MPFAYSKLMNISIVDISIKIFTSNNVFINTYHLMHLKIYLHHTYVTGKIFGVI